jgi:hypothetical protein
VNDRKETPRQRLIRELAEGTHYARVKKHGQDMRWLFLLAGLNVTHDEVKAAAERDAK